MKDKTVQYFHFVPVIIVAVASTIVGVMAMCHASLRDIRDVVTVVCFIGIFSAQIMVPTSVTIHRNFKRMLMFISMWIPFAVLCGSVVFAFDHTARLNIF